MALLSEKEKQQLKQIIADYPNNEDLDLNSIYSRSNRYNRKARRRRLVQPRYKRYTHYFLLYNGYRRKP